MLYSVTNKYQISLSGDWTCGTVTRVYTSELFNTPTTAGRINNGIYTVNAKFGTANEDISTTAYEIVRIDRDDAEAICSA